jgi:glucose/arabinose dehydrogenase
VAHDTGIRPVVIGRRRWAATFTAACLALAIGAGAAHAATLPAGFTDELFATVASPTAISFTSDGRRLMPSQLGKLYIRQNGATTMALDLSSTICSDSERGLLGAAADPNFATNKFIYLYYTYKKFTGCPYNTAQIPVNRVARFTVGAGNVVNAASQLVLIDNIPSPNGNHNGGDLAFDRTGNLYVSVGDGGCDYAGGGCAGANDASRDRNVLLGKILRITPAGDIPTNNPYRGLQSARCNVAGSTVKKNCQETFALGLRNPFRIAIDPNGAGNLLYINDVGQGLWEEIDKGTAGADYGWNVREGHCANGSTTDCGAPPAGMTNPIFDYGHGTCNAITGGAFVPVGAWPAAYDDAYLFGDYTCGRIFQLVPNGSGGFTSTLFGTIDAGGPIDMTFGPNNGKTSLYYTTYANGGQVRRIVYTP